MSLLTIGLLLACGDAGVGTASSGEATTAQPASTGPVPTTGETTSTTGTSTGDATTTDVTTTGVTTGEPLTTGDTSTGAPASPVPVRALFINVGNASPQFGCFEYKLCRPQDIASVRDYIATWQPDVIALSEVLRASQLPELLPPGYTGACGESRDRDTGEPAAWDAADASHEHECVAWNTARVEPIADSARSVYGADGCNYDFTGFRVGVRLDGHELAVVAVHPDSQDAGCRVAEIAAYWSELAALPRVLIGGDWNSDDDAELQRPPDFAIAYLRGQHWTLATHDGEYSAEYAFGLQKKKFDHAFANFGGPVTQALLFGSALGGHDDHPRADGGDGLDHRQLLVDLEFTP